MRKPENPEDSLLENMLVSGFIDFCVAYEEVKNWKTHCQKSARARISRFLCVTSEKKLTVIKNVLLIPPPSPARQHSGRYTVAPQSRKLSYTNGRHEWGRRGICARAPEEGKDARKRKGWGLH